MPTATIGEPTAAVPRRSRKLASGPHRRVVPATGRPASRLRTSTGLLCGRRRAPTSDAVVARYYDPATAQFLTRDPLEDITGAPYSYAGDDPIDNSDPSGQLCIGNYCLGFNPGSIPNSIVNLGRGFSFGLSDKIANWISPGASCTVPQNEAQQLVGNVATIVGLAGVGRDGGPENPGVGPKTGTPNFEDPAQPPGPDWEWRGQPPPGGPNGAWYNPSTGESLHPDLSHPDPIAPHYDYRAPDGTFYRIYPDGTVVPK